MTYTEEIQQTEILLNKLNEKKLKFQEVLKTLKVGDTIYEEGGHGGFDFEYFPQEILEIDIDNCRILTYEKSINIKKWVTCFHIFQDNKFKLII